MEKWIEEILNKVEATLKSCPRKEDRGEWAKERLSSSLGASNGQDAWTEKGPVRIDIWFEKSGKKVAIETESSALDASHDLLKLAYMQPDLALLVLNDPALGSGPRKDTFERVASRVEALRSSPKNINLAKAFQELKIIVIGVRYNSGELPYEVKNKAFL